MKKNILIIHYNTPYLTECLVRSINLFVKDAAIYIFDNSDEKPFTAEFDNVTIIDNTKGQIINFDEWLEKYPNRKISPGRTNQWGSAKHCYSIEKCMELINDGFILLDSDVLLKRDISNLIDDKTIYTGEIVTQPNSSIKRVLPFICYINVKMCKEKGIHYFDDNKMHGLFKSSKDKSDYYDTGASFFLETSKYPHRDIKCNEYIVHYGHGSWYAQGKKPQYTIEQWLRINKKYYTNEKNKKVIYTCITGGYDTLKDPTFITDDFDYVCFTDNDKLISNVWDIRPLPKEVENLSQVKKQRYVKINAHKVLPEYDISIWVDGNIEIKDNLNLFLDETLKDGISVYVPQHPCRNCIYKEASVVISMKKDTAENVNPQINGYREDGFPENYGLLQSNIMLRKHNNEDCVKLMETWFSELKDKSHRDQLSFNYALWKNQDVNIVYMDKGICRSKYFNWGVGHRKNDNKSVGNYVPTIKKKNIQYGSQTKRKSIVQLKDEFYLKINKIPTSKIGLYE